MISIYWDGRDFVLGHQDPTSLIHRTRIITDGSEDIPCPDEETVVDAHATNVPEQRQYVDRRIILGSRMALFTSAHYSTHLAQLVKEVCLKTPMTELPEAERDESCYFIESVSSRLIEQHEPVRRMRAFREDFRYVLAYAPPWKIKYRVQRCGSDMHEIEQTRISACRPVYLHRESAYLRDFQRRMARLETTIMGKPPLVMANFDVWNDIVERV